MNKVALIDTKSRNIGDWVQTLAALQFAPNGEFVTRDEIGDETRDLKIIGNAWWMEGDKFPRLDQDILPISMHIAPKTGDKMFKWLKSREPIGCRDTDTVERLQAAGIEAYFSGCLTLTFPEYRGKREGIVYVDRVPEAWLKADWGGRKVTHLTHHVKGAEKWTPQERIEYARKQLEIYKTAELVITKRLHVALPCIAFGTPVLTEQNVWTPERFSGYDLPTEFIGTKPEDYKVTRPVKLIKELKERVNKYVKGQ